MIKTGELVHGCKEPFLIKNSPLKINHSLKQGLLLILINYLKYDFELIFNTFLNCDCFFLQCSKIACKQSLNSLTCWLQTHYIFFMRIKQRNMHAYIFMHWMEMLNFSFLHILQWNQISGMQFNLGNWKGVLYCKNKNCSKKLKYIYEKYVFHCMLIRV